MRLLAPQVAEKSLIDDFSRVQVRFLGAQTETLAGFPSRTNPFGLAEPYLRLPFLEYESGFVRRTRDTSGMSPSEVSRALCKFEMLAPRLELREAAP